MQLLRLRLTSDLNGEVRSWLPESHLKRDASELVESSSLESELSVSVRTNARFTALRFAELLASTDTRFTEL